MCKRKKRRSKKAIGIMLAVIIAVSVFTLIAIALSATGQNKVGSVPEKNQVEHDIEKLPLDEYPVSIISEDPEFMLGGAIIKFEPNVSVNISAGQGNKKLGTGIIPLGTQTIIINNASNSFPMFSNAEYVNFTIGDDTITLTLDTNASYDGICNLSNITGTNISAAGSFAELEYFSITYRNLSYDRKWESAPYFNSTTNRLHLFSGSGIVTSFKFTMEENSTSVNKTIPKVVGVGSTVGQFQIETTAEGINSTYNWLEANIKGVGYMDSYVQYAPDTSYENTTFIPTFLDCERLELETTSSIEPGTSSILTTTADVFGIARGAEPVPEVSHEWASHLILDVEYFPITYHNYSYNQTWNVSPYFNSTTNRLHLLSGSGIVTKFKFTMEENSTSVNKTIPKVVGVGDLVGQFQIATVAHGKNSTYNELDSSIKGVGYADLYVQYAPDTSYENTPFIPTFSHCEKLQEMMNSIINGSESTVLYQVDVLLGVANGAEPISGVSHDWASHLILDVEYFPITYHNYSYNQTWNVSPYFNSTTNRLHLFSGSGIVTSFKFTMEENSTSVNKTIPKVVGIGSTVGQFQIETTAEGINSTYNWLEANIKGVGYMDSYVQYAPDTSYENTTFIPTFLDCERLQLKTTSVIKPGISSTIINSADVLGIASGVKYLNFNNMPLDNVAINEAFDLEYHPVNISGDIFDEKWSVEPVQYDDILVILRGTGTMTKLNFTFNDSNAAHPEIISYGYLRGDYNLTANILPHYMDVIANGTNVSAMDESGQGGFGITLAVPIITSFAPPSPVNDTVCNWRTFNVTVNQTVNVSWYLNNSLLHTNVSTKEANCTLHAEFVDDNNVSAVATNANGTDMQTWVWNVTAQASVTIPTATGTGNVTINTSSGYFCDEPEALNASHFPGLPGSAITFPHGFFNISICGLNTSNPENVTINFTYPFPIPTNAEFWKYNSSTGTWYRYPFDDNDGDNVISITITDNSAGDHNPALGIINDPNGVGWRIAAAKVPALTPIGMLALIGIMSVVLAVATSRRRK